MRTRHSHQRSTTNKECTIKDNNKKGCGSHIEATTKEARRQNRTKSVSMAKCTGPCSENGSLILLVNCSLFVVRAIMIKRVLRAPPEARSSGLSSVKDGSAYLGRPSIVNGRSGELNGSQMFYPVSCGSNCNRHWANFGHL